MLHGTTAGIAGSSFADDSQLLKLFFDAFKYFLFLGHSSISILAKSPVSTHFIKHIPAIAASRITNSELLKPEE